MPFVEDEQARGTIMHAGFGRGLSFWAEAVRLQALRLAACVQEWDSLQLQPFSVESQRKWGSWHLTVLADAHYLLVGVRHVLRLARILRRAIGQVDQRPAQAIEDFLAGPGKPAEALRDLLEHWDRYSLTEPDRDYPGQFKRPPAEIIADQLHVDVRAGELFVSVGGVEVPTITLANEAIRLATELAAARWEALTPPQPGAEPAT